MASDDNRHGDALGPAPGHDRLGVRQVHHVHFPVAADCLELGRFGARLAGEGARGALANTQQHNLAIVRLTLLCDETKASGYSNSALSIASTRMIISFLS